MSNFQADERNRNSAYLSSLPQLPASYNSSSTISSQTLHLPALSDASAVKVIRPVAPQSRASSTHNYNQALSLPSSSYVYSSSSTTYTSSTMKLEPMSSSQMSDVTESLNKNDEANLNLFDGPAMNPLDIDLHILGSSANDLSLPSSNAMLSLTTPSFEYNGSAEVGLCFCDIRLFWLFCVLLPSTCIAR